MSVNVYVEQKRQKTREIVINIRIKIKINVFLAFIMKFSFILK